MTIFENNFINPSFKIFIFLLSYVYRNQILESKAAVINMSTHKRVKKQYDDIIKSQNDDRLYRGLVLANKMKVLLISDSTTDKSAVALDVNIGNFNHIIYN